MGKERQKKAEIGGKNFIAQAGILAAAGIISRVIGLLYTSPLSGIIGDLGLGYYQAAYSYYTIILLISSYSIPSAISKVIAQKLGAGEYRNAHRLFRGALAYGLVVGGIAGLFLFFCADWFVEPDAVPVLRMFAPTIFVYAILGVLRGYYQAHRSMVQTSVSQILEQIANAVVSVGAAYLMIRITFGTMALPDDPDMAVLRAVKGAMGSALGTGVGVGVALIFMLILYFRDMHIFHEQVAGDPHKEIDSAGMILRSITMIVTPFILSTAVYNLSNSLNTKIYTDFYPTLCGLSTTLVTGPNWGIFSGKAMKISNIPIAFASAMAAAMIPSIAQLVAADRQEENREKIGLAVKTTMLISIPCAVGLFVFAAPVTLLLFPSASSSLSFHATLLMALTPSVVFYALSTLNSSILQGLGKVNTPIVNAAVALVFQTIVAFGLLLTTKLDVYSIAVANTVYAALMAFLNQHAVRKACGYKQEIKSTFGLTFAASVVMGIVSYGVYRGLLYLTGSMRISVIPAVLVAIPVYFVALIKLKAVDETELLKMPKGRSIVAFARKIHLL